VAGVDVEVLPADLAVPEGLSRVAERLRRGVVWGVVSCRVGGVFPVPCDCFVMCGSVLSGGGRWGRLSCSAVLVLGAGVRGCEWGVAGRGAWGFVVVLVGDGSGWGYFRSVGGD